MTNQAYIKATTDLYNIIANHALEDYRQANFKNGKKLKKHVPYSLSKDTLRAKDCYNILFYKRPEEITINEEEQIKALLLIYRTHRTEYLKETGGNKCNE